MRAVEVTRFNGLVRAELRKLRAQRTTWVLGAVLLVLMTAEAGPLLLAPAVRLGADDPGHMGRAVGAIMSQSVDLVVGVVLLVGGARLLGGEYSAGTIRVLVGRGVGRLQLLGAKLTALLIAGVAVLAVGVVVSEGGLIVVGLRWAVNPAGSLGPCLWVVGGCGLASIVACILLPAAAAGIGRSAVFAIAVSMAFFPALDEAGLLLQGLGTNTYQALPEQITDWLLGPALNAMPEQLSGVPGRLLGQALPIDLGHVLLVTAVWCLGFLVVTVALTRRRDVTE